MIHCCVLINVQLVLKQDYNGTVEALLKATQPVHEFIMSAAALMNAKLIQSDVMLTIQILPVSLTITYTLLTIFGKVCFLAPANGLYPPVCISPTLTVLTCEYSLIAYLSLSQ